MGDVGYASTSHHVKLFQFWDFKVSVFIIELPTYENNLKVTRLNIQDMILRAVSSWDWDVVFYDRLRALSIYKNMMHWITVLYSLQILEIVDLKQKEFVDALCHIFRFRFSTCSVFQKWSLHVCRPVCSEQLNRTCCKWRWQWQSSGTPYCFSLCCLLQIIYNLSLYFADKQIVPWLVCNTCIELSPRVGNPFKAKHQVRNNINSDATVWIKVKYK